MDSILIKSNKKRYQYIFIILFVLLLELTVGNFSAIKTALCKPQIIIQDIETDDNGCYQTEMISINKQVKNVFIDLELEEADSAKVVISLTDTGDAYPYELPEMIVVPGVKSTYYANIYPYGDVNEMQISVTVPEWSHAMIHSIAVNVPKPFEFKWIRFILLSIIIICFFYIKNEESMIHSVYCKRGDRKQIFVSAVIVFSLLLFLGVLVRINPKFIELPWPHQHQYQELAHVLKEGSVALPHKPSDGLLHAQNPYDTIALSVEEIEFHMDYAYYNGKYYVYFGLIPEILLFLPYYLITGMDLPNYLANYIICAGFIVGVFGLIWEVIHKFAKKVPYIHYLILCFFCCFCSNYILMMVRPDIYNIPIMMATCLTIWGFFLWLKGLQFGKFRAFYFFLGSLCMAMVAGCRPQMLLYQIVAIPLFYSFVKKERGLFAKKTWLETICFCIPYIMIGMLVFWYNDARFGSGFDFGATYSLTTNDMNQRGFNFARVFQGLFSFLIQPPVFNGDFPFLFSTNLETNYMGRNMTEFTFGGVFATNLLLTGAICNIYKIKKKMKGKIPAIILGFSLCSFAIAAFDVNGAGILQRYMGDMILGFVLAATLIWILFLDKEENNSDYIVRTNVFCILALVGFLYSFFIIFAKGDATCLQNSNPSLFYRIASYFRF